MAKKFMFVCFGILALAVAYAVGASDSVAQAGGQTVVAMSASQGQYGTTALYAITSAGDLYRGHHSGAPWEYVENIFGGAVANEENSLGGVKSLFR